jgi:hypothetical protein
VIAQSPVHLGVRTKEAGGGDVGATPRLAASKPGAGKTHGNRVCHADPACSNDFSSITWMPFDPFTVCVT